MHITNRGRERKKKEEGRKREKFIIYFNIFPAIFQPEHFPDTERDKRIRHICIFSDTCERVTILL